MDHTDEERGGRRSILSSEDTHSPLVFPIMQSAVGSNPDYIPIHWRGGGLFSPCRGMRSNKCPSDFKALLYNGRRPIVTLSTARDIPVRTQGAQDE